MDNKIIFESDRIFFVKISESLIPNYLEMINDMEVQKYLSHNPKEYHYEDEVLWVREKLEEDALIFSMIEKETNDFIGNIEIMKINNNIGTLGISITPKKQNMHFGQEAIKRFIRYAFDNLKLDGLELNVYSYNLRGIHCYEKLGFVKDYNSKSEDDIKMILKK